MPKAMDLAKELLQTFKNDIEILTFYPSSGGVFEVKANDQLIFSKKQLDRFPEPREILEKIQ
ncbi:Rdx family protein [Irregularibacter muris]|uniref:Rdx family protein n=1 Tax=Irregularibacter muris TaxID=1796619 RepID=A0AAE3HCA9_9FIRM|nr:Rdx family protein [Irregularibacter muris]